MIKKDYKEAMNSTAPGAVDPYHAENSHPEMGTKPVAGKSTEPGPHKYRFSTSTPVKDAECDKGKALECVKTQEGHNNSKMEMQTPPQGSKKENPSG